MAPRTGWVTAAVFAAVALGSGAARAGDDEPTVHVRITDDAELSVQDEKGEWVDLGNFASIRRPAPPGLVPADAASQSALLARLRTALQAATGAPDRRQRDGTSTVRLVLEAHVTAKWRYVQWVLEQAVQPSVRIRRLRFVAPRGGAPIDQEFGTHQPAEEMPGPSFAADTSPIRVAMFRMNDESRERAQTKLKLGGTEILVPLSSWTEQPAEDAALDGMRAKVFAGLQTRIAGLHAANADLTGFIDAPPPKGASVPYADFFAVLQAFHAAGIVKVDLPSAVLLPEEDAPPAPSRAQRWPSSPGPNPPGRKVEDAVTMALEWLAAHQSADGRWEAAGWDAWCDGKPAAPPAERGGLGKVNYDIGVTGLALLAFLGAGHAGEGGDVFAKNVQKGLRWLRAAQDPEGCIGPRVSGHFVYNHAIATQALVTAYARTGDAAYRPYAQAALDFVAIARNPYFAWRYGIKPGENDTSVTGWMAMALVDAKIANAAARDAGKEPPFAIDEDAFDGVRAWIDKMTDADYGRAGYIQRGTGPARPADLVDTFPAEKSESMTAIGVLLREFLGPATGGAVEKGAALMAALPPRWIEDGSIDMYYWFYGTDAMWQVGGDRWTAWNAALTSIALDHQRTDGDRCLLRGSWDPADPWGPDGGRVYSTAMMTLCLEAPARYARVTTK